MRLIDADAIKYTTLSYGGWGGQPQEIADKYDIDKMPTVDAKPVVHGRWIEAGWDYGTGGFYWTCSECTRMISDRYGLYNYCPNCGAKMDGGGNA